MMAPAPARHRAAVVRASRELGRGAASMVAGPPAVAIGFVVGTDMISPQVRMRRAEHRPQDCSQHRQRADLDVLVGLIRVSTVAEENAGRWRCDLATVAATSTGRPDDVPGTKGPRLV